MKYWITSDQVKELAQAENGNQIFLLLRRIVKTQSLHSERTESLTKGLVQTLIEFNKHWRGIPLHLQSIPLTKNQFNNFQKLRYHGLVENPRSGYWTITLLGCLFLDGKERVPKSVTLDDGIVIGRSPQKISIHKILGTSPTHSFPQRSDYLD